MTSKPTIAFIGAGAIGFPMAVNLQKLTDVIVVDPFEAAREKAKSYGLSAMGSVSELPQVSHAIVMVANAEQVNQVVIKEELASKLPENGVIVIMSTVGVQPVLDVAEALKDSPVQIVDAPVTGGVTGAENGRLKMYVAGSEAGTRTINPFLKAFGEVLNVSENPGHGQAAKLVNNLLVTTHVITAAEALNFAETLNLDLDAIFPGLIGGAAYSWALDEFGSEMLNSTPTKMRAMLRIFMKDAELIEAAAHSTGSYIPVLEAVNKVLHHAKEANLGEEDSSRVIEVYRANNRTS